MDAEYTYMNAGISAVALGMMLAFNKVRTIEIISKIIVILGIHEPCFYCAPFKKK